ncbi:hypothetical protein GCK72_015512 [Caenorhabditis remanei]|uniref:Uncharacterized protein n=2 Tax=Caenorhabditis remanei TaxID=31234 RepID=A0A6A5GXG1_CAERE|nr:hypothetical protein GCK72_015512 [Caenorhabditis remanei]KAF1759052.1 hypothetical protein GCK72_015512 [Caenorhabditis remanei]
MRYQYCEKCKKKVGESHECGKTFCTICCKPCPKNHVCAHPLPAAANRDTCLTKQANVRYFVYDFETIVRSKEHSIPNHSILATESCNVAAYNNCTPTIVHTADHVFSMDIADMTYIETTVSHYSLYENGSSTADKTLDVPASGHFLIRAPDTLFVQIGSRRFILARS